MSIELEDDFSSAMEKYDIPVRMHGGLRRWIDSGTIPGHFLQAILQNDLRRTFERADEENVFLIRNYLMFLYNDAPAGCWGSMENFERWSNGGGLQKWSQLK